MGQNCWMSIGFKLMGFLHYVQKVQPNNFVIVLDSWFPTDVAVPVPASTSGDKQRLCHSSVTCSEMDQTAASRRPRATQPKPDLYSTVVIHNDDDDDTDQEQRRRKPKSSEKDEDLYGTVVYKGDGRDDEEEDEASLPPLLKRLPKDFGGGAPMDFFDDEEEEEGNDFGTMIVKADRNRPRNRASSSFTRRSHYSAFSDSRQESPGKRAVSDDNEDDDGGAFSTFVVRPGDRESLSGTVVRRRTTTDAGSTMDRAVASMQAVGELGFGKQRRGSGSSQVEEPRQTTKISSSSIPDSVTREDPTIKYELLNELGGFSLFECVVLNFSAM